MEKTPKIIEVSMHENNAVAYSQVHSHKLEISFLFRRHEKPTTNAVVPLKNFYLKAPEFIAVMCLVYLSVTGSTKYVYYQSR